MNFQKGSDVLFLIHYMNNKSIKIKQVKRNFNNLVIKVKLYIPSTVNSIDLSEDIIFESIINYY